MNRRRISILFFAPRLGGGGAEMHLARIIRMLPKEQYKITLALTRKGGNYESMIPDHIRVVHFSNKKWGSFVSTIWALFPLTSLIRKEKPDIFASILDHTNAIAELAHSLSKTNSHFLTCIQNNFSTSTTHWRFPIKLLIPFVRRAYLHSDTIISLSNGVKNDLINNIPGISPQNIQVINNAAWDDEVLEKSKKPLTHRKPSKRPLIVAAGRLTEQKGYFTLIRAIRKVLEKHEIELWILGEGELKTPIKQILSDLEIADNVKLLGFQENPFNIFADADLFVLSSLWEGFGNVIAEAMICGTPVVSTNCPYGPAEILDEGRFGKLVEVENESALASAIIEALENPLWLEKMSREGTERAQSYRASTISEQHHRLFLRIAEDQIGN